MDISLMFFWNMVQSFGRLKHSPESFTHDKIQELKNQWTKKTKQVSQNHCMRFCSHDRAAWKKCQKTHVGWTRSSYICVGNTLHETCMAAHVCEKLQLTCFARKKNVYHTHGLWFIWYIDQSIMKLTHIEKNQYWNTHACFPNKPASTVPAIG